MLIRPEPVSYTHLDVYKRQVDDYPEMAFFNVGTIADVKKKAETLAAQE